MKSKKKYNKSVALVTGASYGLGAEISKTLARDGFDVALTELNVNDLSGTLSSIDSENDVQSSGIELDLRSMDSIENAVSEAIKIFGRIDVLVNNAGLLIAKPAIEVTPDEWDEVMSVNVKGSYFMAQNVAKHLISNKRPGCIVNIASTFSTIGTPNVSPYGISKTSVAGITRHLAVEWAQYGIRVNAVAPGTVETKYRAEIMAADPERRKANISKIPLGRFGTPEDMAEAVSYLASSSADYVNGHVLTVDGGLTIS
tara:strand:- start:5269 stop:6039 length:771 start_codon:yes stop_codon:yes gene_type:complete